VSKEEIIDLCVRKLKETNSAVLVTENIEDNKGNLIKYWLPKSQVEIEENPDGTVIVTLPVWLAIDKGMV